MSASSRDAPILPGAVADGSGRYVAWGERSYATIGFYLVIIGLLVYLNGRPDEFLTYPQIPLVLAALVALYLVRYLTTRYVLDSDRLAARRLFGSRSIPLESIYKIKFASLREMAPVGFFGSWGWRGRMWSPNPSVGSFDSIHTVALGLLVTGKGVPMFISPKGPAEFARELSRRVRSAGVSLDEDDGMPPGSVTAAG